MAAASRARRAHRRPTRRQKTTRCQRCSLSSGRRRPGCRGCVQPPPSRQSPRRHRGDGPNVFGGFDAEPDGDRQIGMVFRRLTAAAEVARHCLGAGNAGDRDIIDKTGGVHQTAGKRPSWVVGVVKRTKVGFWRVPASRARHLLRRQVDHDQAVGASRDGVVQKASTP